MRSPWATGSTWSVWPGWNNCFLPFLSKSRETTRHWGPLLAEWSTHRVYGWLGLGLVLYLSYWIVGVLGAEIAVGFLEKVVFGNYINPFLSRWFNALVPIPFIQDLLVGPYGIFTMALTYALALILPIVDLLFSDLRLSGRLRLPAPTGGDE